MFKKFKAGLSAQRLIDEQLYAQVAEELSEGNVKAGLWTKATADADGNENKIKALYIKYRVQSMQDEAKILEALVDEANNEKTLPPAKKPKTEAELIKYYGIKFSGDKCYYAGVEFSYIKTAIEYAINDGKK